MAAGLRGYWSWLRGPRPIKVEIPAWRCLKWMLGKYMQEFLVLAHEELREAEEGHHS
jgi:hypothetical protein